MSDNEFQNDNSNYKVGYGKPPKHSQFRKGQSGNPKGRPKQSRWQKSTDTLRVEFIDTMEQKITIRENGRKSKKPAILALYNQLLAKALKGDYRSAKLILDTYCKFIYEDEDAHVRLMELLNEIENVREQRQKNQRN